MIKKSFLPIPTRKKSRGTPSKSMKPEPMDFRQSANWRIFRIMAEFVDGYNFLADLHNEVTFFGSGRCLSQSKTYKMALKLAKMLGRDGYTIITGGGAGIMEAANKGAYLTKAESVGLNIQLPFEQRINDYVKKGLGFYFFFTRKVMLSISAQAYVFFPGGYGTLDEFFELLNLVQTKKIAQVPLILIDKAYWQPILQWLSNTVWQKYKAIAQEDLKIYTLVDNIDEAYKIIKKTKEKKFL